MQSQLDPSSPSLSLVSVSVDDYPQLIPNAQSFYQEESPNQPHLQGIKPSSQASQEGNMSCLILQQLEQSQQEIFTWRNREENDLDKHKNIDAQTNVSDMEIGGNEVWQARFKEETCHENEREEFFRRKIELVEEHSSEASSRTERDQIQQVEPPVFYGPLNIDDLSTEPSFNNASSDDLPQIVPQEDPFWWQDQAVLIPPPQIADESTRHTLNVSSDSSLGAIREMAGGYKVSLQSYNELVVVTEQDKLRFQHMASKTLLNIAVMHLQRLGEYLRQQTSLGLRRGHRKELMIVLDMTKSALDLRLFGQMVNVVILFERATASNRRKQAVLEYAICKQRVSSLYLLRQHIGLEPAFSLLLRHYQEKQLYMHEDLL